MGLPDCIPEDKLPQCWSDDVRMNALFAPFRLKTANPESWDMKMKFWSEMLRLWCKHKNDPIVSASDAKFVFQRKGRTSACIDIVVEEMFRNGEVCPLSKYQQILHNGPESWVRWGARLAFKPAAIALTAVSSLLPARQAIDNDGLPKASIDSTQRFVVESAVKDQATALLNSYPLGLERVGTIEELIRNSEWLGSRETFEVLLGWLVAQGQAVKKDDVVKLAEPSKKASPITQTDEALVKLTSAESRLEADIGRLSRDAEAAAAEARAACVLGNKLAAKNHLRRKHKALQRAQRCEAALENIRQALQQMRDVGVNSTIVHTFKTTSEAMKKGMIDNGLTEDNVHDTMDELREVLETCNEIEKAISTPTEDFDAAELEDELNELMKGGTGGGDVREGRKITEPKLPSPPQSKPHRKTSEREFIFDGEEHLIAELNELGIEDASPRRRRDLEGPKEEKPKPKPVPKEPKPQSSKAWYPPKAECLVADTWNDNTFGELRQDDRIHPGQPLNVDFTSPPRLYNTDFQVQDHKMAAGVWLYNKDTRMTDSDLASSTEYVSSESPGKAGGSFQMAPGGERKQSNVWPNDEQSIEDLEKRLKSLRGLNL